MTNSLGSIFSSTNPSGKKVWKVELIIGTNPNGSKRTVRRTAHSKRDAERLRMQMRRQLDEGKLGKQSFKKIDEFALWWIRDIKARKVKASTAADYEDRYRNFVKPTFGNRPLTSVLPSDITQWMAELSMKGYSDATLNGALTLAKSMFNAAVNFGEITRSPTDGIPLISNARKSRVRPPWTLLEASIALRAARGEFLELPLLFAIHLGLRIGEIVGLKWSDMNFTEGTVHVRRTVRDRKHYEKDGSYRYILEIGSTKTNSSNREIVLTQDLQLALLAHRERLQNAGHFTSTGWVLANRSANPIRPNRLAKLYKKFLVEKGLRPIRFHDLRHTSAVLCLEAGVRLEAISQNLGHAKVDTTKQIYAPHVKALSREYSEAIQAHLRPEQNTLEISTERTKK